ncbi:MAG: hypothetical protein JWQ03_2527 [Variovorax sp.]|nr:hypothetical protein [Variovorax sp.]
MPRRFFRRINVPIPPYLSFPAALSWAGALLLATALAHAQPPSETAEATKPASASSPAKAAASGKPPSSSSHRTSSQWAGLTPAQQTALKPLESHWDGLSDPQKRKWLALSRNYASLSPEGQSTLHERMTGWMALTPRQRAQARLNFAEVKRLAPDERKAQWEAYLALSEEERRKLAAKAVARPPSAAIPVRPVPAQKLVQVPPPAPKGQQGARIELAPPSRSAPRTRAPSSGAAAPMGASVPATPPSPPAIPPVPMTEQPSALP